MLNSAGFGALARRYIQVLADTIFRTRENRKNYKEHGIHLNGPKLGKPPKDPDIRRQELRQEWLESDERGDIKRRFGIGKRCYTLGRVKAKLKHPRSQDSSVCSDTQFAKDAQTSFELPSCIIQTVSNSLTCAIDIIERLRLP